MRAIPIVIACLFLLTSCTPMNVREYQASPYTNNGELVLVVLDSGLCGRNESVIRRFVAEDYKQHNPMAEDGREGLLTFVRSLGGVEVSITPKRLLIDGDFVAVHSDVWIGQSHFAVFDLFVVEYGMLREHWDCMQEQPDNGEKSIDLTRGTTEMADLQKTESNRTLIERFAKDILIERQLATLDKYVARCVLEHSLVPFGQLASGANVDPGQSGKYKTVHRVVAEGNFVLTQSEGEFSGKKAAIYDLWRIDNGKIVEHWSTIQEVPATSRNKNGMF